MSPDVPDYVDPERDRDRPERDSDQLRAIAEYLDLFDRLMAAVTVEGVEGAEVLTDILNAGGQTMQNDLRRIADRLDKADNWAPRAWEFVTSPPWESEPTEG